ncbi:PH domain-containing protein [Calidifontibacter sp. DB0510]|uniref:PH domain-containing protein n=1 Tax=Metallococcus carri TaxID=1656884 RepID=A0A967B2F0_9MICO|nr:PH domain-containing protein [Metallococcus carri]NHN56767.1 PH domain-containing protein [Metallococcus carri]NOP37856.1 PH domain-containing protein [Calidifontibacter sp. DB2511S]
MTDLIDRHGAEAFAPILVDDERLVLVLRQHWMRLLGTGFAWFVALVLTIWIGVVTPESLGFWSDLAWWVLFAMALYAVVVVLNWRHDWFVATDKRLMLRYGLVFRRTAMMPLGKVTDMSFDKPPVGRAFGFGSFVLESAGQDQALREITYIPHADAAYRRICEELFGSPDPRPHPVQMEAVGRAKGRRFTPEGATAPSDGRDDTDVPLMTLGSYLDRALPNSGGRMRRRVLRGPAPADPPPAADDADKEPEDGPFDSPWIVSHEDSSPPQQVRREREED